MKKWILLLIVIIIILIASIIASTILEKSNISSENKIAVIPIYGTIISGENSFFDTSTTNSQTIQEFIKRANEDNSVKAIILEINSGGGTVVASKEIADAVKSTNKPTVAVIREIGASGAYWIASASDVIVADELSVTGSIGVLGSYIEISDLMDKYGVTYKRLVAGEYKDTGTPFKSLTEEERKILQAKLDIIYDFFVTDVAKNRNIPKENLKELSTGMFYLGIEAKDLGLVDYLGNKELAINISKELAGIKEARIITYEKKTSILDLLSKLSAPSFYFIGRGIGSSFYESIKMDSKQFNFIT